MSEKINHNNSEKNIHNHEAHRDKHEKIKHSIEKEAKAAKHEHSENIEKIRATIGLETEDTQSSKKYEAENNESGQPTLVNKEIKDISYRRTLKKVQSKLTYSSRVFSKIVHQPTIEKVSDITSKTIARPSGILFGGLFSFIGSSIFLWTARHYGYEYNFLLFLIFFVVGFMIGLTIELIVRSLKKK